MCNTKTFVLSCLSSWYIVFIWLVWNWDTANVSLWRRMDWTTIQPWRQDPSIPSNHLVDLSQSEMPIVRSCYLWPLMRPPACCWGGREWESGRALCPGMTQTQTYAPDTEPACLKERGQSVGWVQDDRGEDQQSTDRQTDTTQADKPGTVETETYAYGHKCKQMYTNTKTQSRGGQTWNVKQASLCCGWVLPKPAKKWNSNNQPGVHKALHKTMNLHQNHFPPVTNLTYSTQTVLHTPGFLHYTKCRWHKLQQTAQFQRSPHTLPLSVSLHVSTKGPRVVPTSWPWSGSGL